jgi:hypothetical protein
VFVDYHSLRLGQPYPSGIWSQLLHARVMVTLIGERWLAVGPAGGRLIDGPGDWVRREIEIALGRAIPVIPVLVNGASRPAANDLPTSIQALALHQSVDLAGANFEPNLDRLIDELAAIIDTEPAGGPRVRPAVGPSADAAAPNRGLRRRSMTVMCTVAFLVTGGGITLWRTGPPPFAHGRESLSPQMTRLPPTATAPSASAARSPSPSAKPSAATTPPRTRSASPSSTAAPASPVPSGQYQLYNPETGFCLGERLPKASDGSTFYGYTQEGCRQARTLTITGGPGHYRLTDPVRHACVGPNPNALAHEGVVIEPVACDWSPATVVEWDLTGTSTVTMISRTDPTRCMTAKAVKAGLAFLRMDGCGGDKTALQRWTLRKVP